MSPKWGKDWETFPGTETDWRLLRQPHHWAEVNRDGTWSIFSSHGRKNKIAFGYEASPDVAKRVIKEWEERN